MAMSRPFTHPGSGRRLPDRRKCFRHWLKLPGLLGAMALLSAQASAASIETTFRGTAHETLFDVSFDGLHGLAVGDAGLLLETDDGGATWSRSPAAFTSLGLFGVVRNNGKCLAVGQMGAVFRAPDCRTWEKVENASQGRLLEVDLNASGVAYAVGGFGEVQRSLDGGESWQPLLLDWGTLAEGFEPHLYSVNVDDNGVVTIAGELELIIRSEDGGETWSLSHKGEKSIFSMFFLTSGVGYAVGQEGVMLKTIDGGATWRQLNSPTRSILTGVWANSGGKVQVTGVNTLLSSADAGRSFRKNTEDSRIGWFQAVAASTAEDGEVKIVVVGSGASIETIRSADYSDKVGE